MCSRSGCTETGVLKSSAVCELYHVQDKRWMCFFSENERVGLSSELLYMEQDIGLCCVWYQDVTYK